MKFETGYEEVDYRKKFKKNKEKKYRVCLVHSFPIDNNKPWYYGKYNSFEEANRVKEKIKRSHFSFKEKENYSDRIWVERLDNNGWKICE